MLLLLNRFARIAGPAMNGLRMQQQEQKQDAGYDDVSFIATCSSHVLVDDCGLKVGHAGKLVQAASSASAIVKSLPSSAIYLGILSPVRKGRQQQRPTSYARAHATLW